MHYKRLGPFGRLTCLGFAFVSTTLLSGCATQGMVRKVSLDTQKSLVQERKMAQELAKSNQVDGAFRASQDARLNSLAVRLAQVQQNLRATEKRLVSDEARFHHRLFRVQHPSKRSSSSPSKSRQKPRDAFMEVVTQKAKRLASHPYKPPSAIPAALTSLHYSAYTRIRFHGSVPNWPVGTAFQLVPSPAGYLFHHAVNLYLLEKGKPVLLHFPIKDFSFNTSLAKQLHGHVPLAGFSLYHPFRSGGGTDEFLSFLGASYFRALGEGQSWGLSARGLAVDTAVPDHEEEFPRFRDFWFNLPKKNATSLSYYALLDSPGFTGAYHFVVRPGKTTTVAVHMTLFTRKSINSLGIAPLTSMYLQGSNGSPHVDPLIRAAHDSDGLSIESKKGGWSWIPVRDPKRLTVLHLHFKRIQGFGLMQRARKYVDYQAWGMNYQTRPSAWVTPTGGDWNDGDVVLVELPTNSQTNDNITAFWEPKNLPHSGQTLHFSYIISWQGDHQTLPPLGHVVSTRSNHSHLVKTYVINFRGGVLKNLPAWIHVKPIVTVSGPAKVVKSWVGKNKSNGNWRLQFSVAPEHSGSIRIKAGLVYKKHSLTETWEDQR